MAFSILALSLGVLFSLFSTGLRNISVAREHDYAIAMAEAKLAEIGVVEVVEAGVQEGDFDNQYRWRTEIADYDWHDDPVAPVQAVASYLVTVEVTWTDLYGEHSVTLTTLRLADRPL